MFSSIGSIAAYIACSAARRDLSTGSIPFKQTDYYVTFEARDERGATYRVKLDTCSLSSYTQSASLLQGVKLHIGALTLAPIHFEPKNVADADVCLGIDVLKDWALGFDFDGRMKIWPNGNLSSSQIAAWFNESSDFVSRTDRRVEGEGIEWAGAFPTLNITDAEGDHHPILFLGGWNTRFGSMRNATSLGENFLRVAVDVHLTFLTLPWVVELASDRKTLAERKPGTFSLDGFGGTTVLVDFPANRIVFDVATNLQGASCRLSAYAEVPLVIGPKSITFGGPLASRWPETQALIGGELVSMAGVAADNVRELAAPHTEAEAKRLASFLASLRNYDIVYTKDGQRNTFHVQH